MWLDDDIEAALEWAEWKASLCSGCGHPRHESYNPDNADAYEAVPVQCHACAARDAENRRASKARTGEQFSDGAFDGVYTIVTERGAGG